MDWNYAIPYGLLYAKEPSEDVSRFLTAIGQLNEGGASLR